MWSALLKRHVESLAEVTRPRSLSLSRRSASPAVHFVGFEPWRLAEMEKCQHTLPSTIHCAEGYFSTASAKHFCSLEPEGVVVVFEVVKFRASKSALGVGPKATTSRRYVP